jgi:hypothetical protein
MTFDKESCTVCLEIDALYLSKFGYEFRGYEHLFGAMGCQSVYPSIDPLDRNSLYDGRHSICPVDSRGAALLANLENMSDKKKSIEFFKLLASAKKLNVMGVDKCIEKVLFSFQVCYVSHKKIILNNCGKKVYTENISCCAHEGFNNSYRVHAEVPEYSYQYISTLDDSDCESTTTIAPSTTQCTTHCCHSTSCPSTTCQYTTTVLPTTVLPTTVLPTTVLPTTVLPTTELPTTEPPTTVLSTTVPPTTVLSTTEPPTTVLSTTEPPTTVLSTTEPPTTVLSTTEFPTTTGRPTTDPPTTLI